MVRPWVLGAAGLVVLLAGCGGGPRLRELGPQGLVQRGVEAYQDEDWDMAVRVFERLVSRYPTHPRIEEIRFHLANSYYGKGEYLTAADEFVRLATDFPRGQYADDARFRVCEAYRELSPDVQRDQEYTRAAIDHCQALVDYFPTSEYASRAREIITEMREKLARKVMIGGEFYYSRKAYDSAILYYEDVLEKHAESSVVPKALLRLVQIYTELGYEEDAEGMRERLLEQYPDSPEAEQARDISLASGS